MEQPKILFVESRRSGGKIIFRLITEDVSKNTTWTFSISDTKEFLSKNPDVKLIIFNTSNMNGSEEEHAALEPYDEKLALSSRPMRAISFYKAYIREQFPNAKVVLFSGYLTMKIEELTSLGIRYIEKPTVGSYYIPVLKKLIE